LIQSKTAEQMVYGFSALKGGDFLFQDVKQLLKQPVTNWTVLLDYHFGGFAKTNNELKLFMQRFLSRHAIELEPVYTAKMFYALYDLIQQDQFKPGQRLIAIHTGGLQGNRS